MLGQEPTHLAKRRGRVVKVTAGVEAFSGQLRDETNLEALNEHLVRVIAETMQPEHAFLWLRPDTISEDEQAE
jgi:hypothetical protein